MNADELWPGDPARRAQWEQLLDWLDPRPGERVLDVGCGDGAAVRFLAEKVGPKGRAVGLERLSGRLNQARERSTEIKDLAPTFVGGDARVLPFPAASFDAVLCVNVLEAIPDQLGALAELRRVLRPGGRILLAHGDYESMVYAGADRDLTRRAVLAYANSKFKSYPTSDGQMGRHLWARFSKAGFADAEIRVLPLVNTVYREPFLGWVLAQFDTAFIAAVSNLNQAEIDRWHAELAAASDRDEYFFCLNLYVCMGSKL